MRLNDFGDGTYLCSMLSLRLLLRQQIYICNKWILRPLKPWQYQNNKDLVLKCLLRRNTHFQFHLLFNGMNVFTLPTGMENKKGNEHFKWRYESYRGLTFSGFPCLSMDIREGVASSYQDRQREQAARSCARVHAAWYPLPTSATPVASRLGLQHGKRLMSANSSVYICNIVFRKWCGATLNLESKNISQWFIKCVNSSEILFISMLSSRRRVMARKNPSFMFNSCGWVVEVIRLLWH